VTDLERLFQQLVAVLAAADPAQLNRPVALGAVQTSILPYRSFRRALGVDTVEDYDLLLLRLAAGEGGFARTTDDARARFAKEVASPNPDLGILRALADTTLTLEGLRVARALAAGESAHDAYAPPAPVAERAVSFDPPTGARAPAVPDELDLEFARPLPSAPISSPPASAPAPAPSEPALMCLYCGATLPTGRTVNFCPSCGQSQTTPRCPQCQSEVELGWRHCISCGAILPNL
jgi:hypothetical protein